MRGFQFIHLNKALDALNRTIVPFPEFDFEWNVTKESGKHWRSDLADFERERNVFLAFLTDCRRLQRPNHVKPIANAE